MPGYYEKNVGTCSRLTTPLLMRNVWFTVEQVSWNCKLCSLRYIVREQSDEQYFNLFRDKKFKNWMFIPLWWRLFSQTTSDCSVLHLVQPAGGRAAEEVTNETSCAAVRKLQAEGVSLLDLYEKYLKCKQYPHFKSCQKSISIWQHMRVNNSFHQWNLPSKSKLNTAYWWSFAKCFASCLIQFTN